MTAYLDNFPQSYGISIFLISYLFQLGIFIPLVLQVYFNIKNINFTQYVYDIMQGYNIVDYYEDSSIFIKSSPFAPRATAVKTVSYNTRSLLSEIAECSSSSLESESDASSYREKNQEYKKFYEQHRAFEFSKLNSSQSTGWKPNQDSSKGSVKSDV